MRSATPNRAAMEAALAPLSARAAKASTWSAGCMAARTTFSAREISAGEALAGTRRQGTGMSGGTLAFLGELGEGPVAAAAGDDGVEIGGIVDRLDDEVGEDPERGDGGLHLGRGLEAGIGLAHVLVGERELVKGDEQHVGGALAVGGAHGRLLADGDERWRASRCSPCLSEGRRLPLFGRGAEWCV